MASRCVYLHCVFLHKSCLICVWHDYMFGSESTPTGQGAAGFHLWSFRMLAWTHPSRERCRLDVPVTKLSISSDSPFHHAELGSDPRYQKPIGTRMHTNMQIDDKINITLQTSHPSVTSFRAVQHWCSNTNQALRQREWLNAILSSLFYSSLSSYHSHAVSLLWVAICHFSCTTLLLLLSYSFNTSQTFCPSHAGNSPQSIFLSAFKPLSISSAMWLSA